jgi:hypothetical protein
MLGQGRVLLLATAFSLGALAAFAGDRAESEKALKEALKKSDAAAVEKACQDLAASGGKDSLAPILAGLAHAEGATYWQLVSGAGAFTDDAALEELGKWIVAHGAEPRSSSADLVFVLGSNGTPGTLRPLVHVLEKGRLDLQLMAVDALAALRCVEATDALVAAVERETKAESELRRRLESALATLTGQELAGKAWTGWWREQRSKGLPETAPEKARDRELGRSMERAAPTNVVVLSGDRTGAGDDERDNDFDKIQTILERRGIKHTVVKKFEFEKDPKKYLAGCHALLVNCNRISPYCACAKCFERPPGETKNRLGPGCNPECKVHKTVCYKLSKDALAAIKTWVEAEGGFLYTEDWGILDVVEEIWPDRVVSGTGATTPTQKPRLLRQRAANGQSWDPHFDVFLRPGHGSPSHPLMRGVWQRSPAPPAKGDKGEGGGEGTTEKPRQPGQVFVHHWQIDDEAPAIEVQDAVTVTTLLESEDLAKLAEGNGAVAITFRPGVVPPKGKTGTGGGGTGEYTRSKSGRVLHTISHFGHQNTSEDGQALENLLLNFLLEASKQRESK